MHHPEKSHTERVSNRLHGQDMFRLDMLEVPNFQDLNTRVLQGIANENSLK
jgi:hypothetical protein